MIQELVNSDWFTLLVGIAGIVSALAAITAVSKINTVITQSNRDSNRINQQTQTAKGKNIAQAGRDINKE